MRITRLTSERDAHPTTVELSLEQLTELLSTFRYTECTHTSGKCNARKGPAWSPGITDGARGDAHITGADVLAFDLDHLTPEQCERMLAAIAGFRFLVHTTHSHTEADICLRLVMFPTRSIARHEIKPLRAAIIAAYGLPADPVTKNEERLYFLPSAPSGSSPWAGSHEGALVDVDSLLALPPPAPAPTPMPEAADGPIELDPLRERLRNVTGASRDIARKILRGERLAESGNRDTALNQAAGVVAFTVPGAPIEAMLELMRESVNAMDPPESGTWLEMARDKLERAIVRQQLAAADKAERAAAADLLFRSAAAEAGDGDARPFTAEQVERWAVEQGTTAEAFQRQWIIQHGGGYWIFDNGRYASVLGEKDAEVSVFRDLSRAPVQLYQPTKGGDVVRKPFKKLTTEYGSVARSVRSSLILQASRYSQKEQRFYEAVRPLRELPPTFDPEVHEYLGLFGGNQAERFLDWCALLPDLNQLLCAVYMMGEKNTGKTLFAHGVARLWSEGSPSKLQNALAGFNDTLVTNPFCFADERLPDSDTIIDDLRELIGSKDRQLNRKFLNTTDLEGCVRLFIAANNDGLLRSAKASITQADVDALVDRIFFIDQGSAPTAFLEKLRVTKGPNYLDSFKTQDRIAKHILYLAEHRRVQLEGRFGVKGMSHEFHEQLLTDIEHVSNVLEFLVRFICNEASMRTPSPHLILGGGKLLVTTEFVAAKDRWEKFIVSRRTPTAKNASDALKCISIASENRNGLVYSVVDVGLITRWAKRRQVGNVAVLEQYVHKPTELAG